MLVRNPISMHIFAGTIGETNAIGSRYYLNREIHLHCENV